MMQWRAASSGATSGPALLDHAGHPVAGSTTHSTPAPEDRAGTPDTALWQNETLQTERPSLPAAPSRRHFIHETRVSTALDGGRPVGSVAQWPRISPDRSAIVQSTVNCGRWCSPRSKGAPDHPALSKWAMCWGDIVARAGCRLLWYGFSLPLTGQSESPDGPLPRQARP